VTWFSYPASSQVHEKVWTVPSLRSCTTTYETKVKTKIKTKILLVVFDTFLHFSGSGGPDRGKLCCVVGQDTLLSQCLSPPRCKWVLANLLPGVTLRWTSIPSGWEVEILLVASCYRSRVKLLPDGPPAKN